MDQTGSSLGGMSIAMRMKMNRDAMYGNQSSVEQPVGSLYAKNPFTGIVDKPEDNMLEFEQNMNQLLSTPQSNLRREQQSPIKSSNDRIAMINQMNKR